MLIADHGCSRYDETSVLGESLEGAMFVKLGPELLHNHSIRHHQLHIKSSSSRRCPHPFLPEPLDLFDEFDLPHWSRKECYFSFMQISWKEVVVLNTEPKNDLFNHEVMLETRNRSPWIPNIHIALLITVDRLKLRERNVFNELAWVFDNKLTSVSKCETR
jgi:hypothetical protein